MKAKLINYNIKKIITLCENTVYIIENSDKTVINLLIPSCVRKLNDLSIFKDMANTDLIVTGGSGIINATELFEGYVLNTIDLSNALKLNGMFKRTHINNLKLPKFKTKSAIYMSEMFRNSNINILELDTSKVEKFNSMFNELKTNILEEINTYKVVKQERQ